MLSGLNYMEWVTEHDLLWGYDNKESPENLLHYALALVEETIEAHEIVSYYKSSSPRLGIELVDCVIYVQKLLIQLRLPPKLLEDVVIIPLGDPEDIYKERDHFLTVAGRIAGAVKKHIRASTLSRDQVYVEPSSFRGVMQQYMAHYVEDIGRMTTWLINPADNYDGPLPGLVILDYYWYEKFGVLHERWGKECDFDRCPGWKGP